MVGCFVPGCPHVSDKKSCSFYRFPRNPTTKRRWVFAIRRADRQPGPGARVCSCHFRENRDDGPVIFPWNKDKEKKLEKPECPPQKKIKQENDDTKEKLNLKLNALILENELINVKRELEDLKKLKVYSKSIYTVSNLNARVFAMETGLSLDIFNMLVEYIGEDMSKVKYVYGWKVEKIPFQDQILLVLMKLRHNYNYLHLAQIFNCSETMIANTVTTFIHVLHEFLFVDLTETAILTRHKNENSMADSFPLRKLSPESDKEVVEESRVPSHSVAGDQILADKDSPSYDNVPPGISVDIPTFLKNDKFSKIKIQLIKRISKYRIHVEKADGRLNEFKILNSIPLHLRPHTDKIVKICAVLVNLQNPLIKDITKTIEME